VASDREILELLEAIAEHPALEEIAKDAGMSHERARGLVHQLKSVLGRRMKQAILVIDGASKGNPGPSGAGVVLRDADGWEIDAMSIPLGIKTNNEAEYLALVHGLRRARELGIERIRVLSDSELLIKQMTGDYQIKDRKILKLALEVGKLRRAFEEIAFEKASRSVTRRADRLARTASHTSEAQSEDS